MPPTSSTVLGRFAATLRRLAVLAVGVGLVAQLPADSLGNWHLRTQPRAGRDLRAVTHGNGWFVAVGDETNAFRSADAVDWIPSSSQFSTNLTGVAYGGGTFVAVGAGGRIFTSSDGEFWTERNSNVSEKLYGVTYGNGVFAAVGGSATTNRVVTSTNGVNWVVRPTGLALASPTLGSVAWGNGRFVAVSAKNVLVSTNGITWTAPTLPTIYELRAVTYGNDRFVAVGAYTTIVSTNGSNWVQGISGPLHYPEAITYGPAGFLAPGDGMWLSPDGLAWTNRDPNSYGLPTLGGWFWGATCANGTYVIVGQDQWILTTTDASHFINRSSFLNNTLHSVAFGQGRFVAVDGSGRIGISTNASDWRVLTHVSNGLPLYRVRYVAGRFVTVGQDGLVASSIDGSSWQAQTLPTTNALRGIGYGFGLHVLTGDGGRIFVSPNGTNWVVQNSGTTNALNGVALGGGLLVAVGGSVNSRVVATSTNGLDWSIPSQSGGAELRSVAYGHERFVAVSALYDFLISTNGIAWTTYRAGPTQRWRDIAFADGYFVAVGGAGSYIMATSPDGVNWPLNTPGGGSLRGLTHGNGTFVAVGDWGAVVQSDPRVWLSMVPGPAPTLVVSGPLGDYRIDRLEVSGETFSWLPDTNTTATTSPWAWPIADESRWGVYRGVWTP